VPVLLKSPLSALSPTVFSMASPIDVTRQLNNSACVCSPNVHLAAHSRPHPSEPVINVRVQTTGTVPAAEALATACTNVEKVCDHMETTLEKALEAFRAKKAEEAQSMDASD
jgi:DNA-directed RNA polymerase subunit L